MAVSAATVNARVESAISLLESGDYGGAIDALLAAEAALAAIPDVTDEGGGGLEWDRAAISRLLDSVRRRQTQAAATAAGGGGIRRQKIEYANPREC